MNRPTGMTRLPNGNYTTKQGGYYITVKKSISKYEINFTPIHDHLPWISAQYTSRKNEIKGIIEACTEYANIWHKHSNIIASIELFVHKQAAKPRQIHGLQPFCKVERWSYLHGGYGLYECKNGSLWIQGERSWAEVKNAHHARVMAESCAEFIETMMARLKPTKLGNFSILPRVLDAFYKKSPYTRERIQAVRTTQ